jgi:hypothetical protein
MRVIAMLLSKQIRRIADPRNMSEENLVKKDGITDSILPDVEVTKALSRHRMSPIHTTPIIIEHGGSDKDVGKTQIRHDKAEILDGFGGRIGSQDFSLTGATAGATLTVSRPRNGSTRSKRDMTPHGAGGD